MIRPPPSQIILTAGEVNLTARRLHETSLNRAAHTRAVNIIQRIDAELQGTQQRVAPTRPDQQSSSPTDNPRVTSPPRTTIPRRTGAFWTALRSLAIHGPSPRPRETSHGARRTIVADVTNSEDNSTEYFNAEEDIFDGGPREEMSSAQREGDVHDIHGGESPRTPAIYDSNSLVNPFADDAIILPSPPRIIGPIDQRVQVDDPENISPPSHQLLDPAFTSNVAREGDDGSLEPFPEFMDIDEPFDTQLQAQHQTFPYMTNLRGIELSPPESLSTAASPHRSLELTRQPRQRVQAGIPRSSLHISQSAASTSPGKDDASQTCEGPLRSPIPHPSTADRRWVRNRRYRQRSHTYSYVESEPDDSSNRSLSAADDNPSIVNAYPISASSSPARAVLRHGEMGNSAPESLETSPQRTLVELEQSTTPLVPSEASRFADQRLPTVLPRQQSHPASTDATSSVPSSRLHVLNPHLNARAPLFSMSSSTPWSSDNILHDQPEWLSEEPYQPMASPFVDGAQTAMHSTYDHHGIGPYPGYATASPSSQYSLPSMHDVLAPPAHRYHPRVSPNPSSQTSGLISSGEQQWQQTHHERGRHQGREQGQHGQRWERGQRHARPHQGHQSQRGQQGQQGHQRPPAPPDHPQAARAAPHYTPSPDPPPPNTPHHSMAVYNDSLPPDSQPQTPANLEPRRPHHGGFFNLFARPRESVGGGDGDVQDRGQVSSQIGVRSAPFAPGLTVTASPTDSSMAGICPSPTIANPRRRRRSHEQRNLSRTPYSRDHHIGSRNPRARSASAWNLFARMLGRVSGSEGSSPTRASERLRHAVRNPPGDSGRAAMNEVGAGGTDGAADGMIGVATSADGSGDIYMSGYTNGDSHFLGNRIDASNIARLQEEINDDNPFRDDAEAQGDGDVSLPSAPPPSMSASHVRQLRNARRRSDHPQATVEVEQDYLVVPESRQRALAAEREREEQMERDAAEREARRHEGHETESAERDRERRMSHVGSGTGLLRGPIQRNRSSRFTEEGVTVRGDGSVEGVGGEQERARARESAMARGRARESERMRQRVRQSIAAILRSSPSSPSSPAAADERLGRDVATATAIATAIATVAEDAAGDSGDEATPAALMSTTDEQAPAPPMRGVSFEQADEIVRTRFGVTDPQERSALLLGMLQGHQVADELQGGVQADSTTSSDSENPGAGGGGVELTPSRHNSDAADDEDGHDSRNGIGLGGDGDLRLSPSDDDHEHDHGRADAEFSYSLG
ncbi:MAG: hypothetical protein M1819_007019 [Sarea resinae]|nr:MAG: hypothetical protein M1819_007019 [Sarea resinae]